MAKKIYLSGPMTGKPNHNREAFSMYTDNLSLCYGWQVVNPHDISVHQHEGECPEISIKVNPNSDHSWQCSMRTDMEELIKCDAIAMMPGWDGSHGARAEHALAATIGLPIYYYMNISGFKTSTLVSLPVLHPSKEEING